jgi:hypothetical protein
MIDTYDGAETGFWVNSKALTDKHYWMDGDNKVEIIKELSPSHPHAEYSYKITLLSPEDGNVLLLEYDGVNKRIQTFRRGDWVNRLYRYFYRKERCYLQDRAEDPNFQLIEY